MPRAFLITNKRYNSSVDYEDNNQLSRGELSYLIAMMYKSFAFFDYRLLFKKNRFFPLLLGLLIQSICVTFFSNTIFIMAFKYLPPSGDIEVIQWRRKGGKLSSAFSY